MFEGIVLVAQSILVRIQTGYVRDTYSLEQAGRARHAGIEVAWTKGEH